MNKSTVFFMYHELELPERDLCDDESGYVRYVVTEKTFRDQMAVIERNGWAGWNVSESLRLTAGTNDEAKHGVCLTFDDGCATDLLSAAPLLREKGFGATFYVTVDHLGRRGYLTKAQLRELSDLGFEVGSHSLTHRYLNDLGASEIKVELSESKQRLEEITERPVVHFSCPGGRVNSLIDKIARETGYASVVTSRIGANGNDADRFSLKRIAVKRGMPIEEFENLARGQGLRVRQAETAVLDVAKRVLGNTMYERIRSNRLGRRP